ncbi:TPA: hypothetical protein ACIJYK_000104 [Serratia marcescens]
MDMAQRVLGKEIALQVAFAMAIDNALAIFGIDPIYISLPAEVAGRTNGDCYVRWLF